MINDGAKSSEPSDVETYISISFIKANAAALSFFDVDIGIFAMKPIKRGEEILMTYNPKYWSDFY